MITLMMDTSLYDVRRWYNGRWVYDRPTDWDRAKLIGIGAAAVKSSERLYIDPGFAIQWKAAAGRPRVAWHFLRQNTPPLDQAKFFVDTIMSNGWNNDSDIPCADWETTDGKDRLDCLRGGGVFLDEVVRQLGRCAVYTYPAYWKKIGGEGATWFKKFPLFLAQWPLDNWIVNIKLPPYAFRYDKLMTFIEEIDEGTRKPMALAPWGNDIMNWQFTARAWTQDIPGHAAIKTLADLNAIYKPWWTGDIITPPPPPPPPQSNLYAFRGTRLWVFERPDSNSRITNKLIHDQTVNVLRVVSANGDQWAQIEAPAGYCRFTWLEKL